MPSYIIHLNCCFLSQVLNKLIFLHQSKFFLDEFKKNLCDVHSHSAGNSSVHQQKIYPCMPNSTIDCVMCFMLYALRRGQPDQTLQFDNGQKTTM